MNLDWPPELVLFLDRGASANLLVKALQGLGILVRRHDAIFSQNTPDTVWLTYVGQQGWLVLTLDQNISYNALERQALLGSRVGSFVLIAKKQSGQQIIYCVTQALPAMRAFAERTARPFIAKIYADSRGQELVTR